MKIGTLARSITQGGLEKAVEKVASKPAPISSWIPKSTPLPSLSRDGFQPVKKQARSPLLASMVVTESNKGEAKQRLRAALSVVQSALAHAPEGTRTQLENTAADVSRQLANV